MKPKSLTSRIILSIISIILGSIIVLTVFYDNQVNDELSFIIEDNAQALLDATRALVESQYKSIQYHRSSSLEFRKQALRNQMDIAFAVIEELNRRYTEGEISLEEARQKALNYIKNMRYENNTGYFWINDTGKPYPKMIMHATIPELDGTILDNPEFNCTLDEGLNLFVEAVDTCLENREGYINYLWPKPMPDGLTSRQPKTSFVRIFEPWNWIIGSGVYIDDIEKTVEDRTAAVIEELNRATTEYGIGENGYFFIFDNKGNMLVHPNLAGQNILGIKNELTGNDLTRETMDAAVSENNSIEYLGGKPDEEGNYTHRKITFATYFEPLGWYIGASVYKEDFRNIISNFRSTMIFFSALFMVLTVFVAFLISESVTKPLRNYIHSIEKTDRDGIPVERIPETDILEIHKLGETMNSMISSIRDTRKELKKQRDFSFRIIDISPFMILELDQNRKITFVNPAGEVITGYSKQELIGKEWNKIICTDGQPGNADQLFRDFTSGRITDYEVILTDKNGRKKNIIWNSFSMITEEKKQIIGFGDDVTEQKKTEEELRSAHIQIKRIIEFSFQISIIATDNKGLITIFNSGAERMLGYRANEVIGSGVRVLELIHLDSEIKERSRTLTKEAGYPVKGFDVFAYNLYKNQYEEREWTYVRKDGTHLTVNLITTRILDEQGKTLGLLGFAQDITEKKKSEESLKNLRNYLSNIIDSMPSVLVGVDSNGRVTEWNKTAEKFTGISSKKAYSQILSDIFPFMSRETAKINESISTRRIIRDTKKLHIDNEVIYEDITIYPLVSSSDKGAVIRMDDVTEKKRMEEMMIQSEKMLSVGGLAAGMAHEINNPLASMIQSAAVLSARMGEDRDIEANAAAAEEAGTSIEAIRKYMKLRKIDRMLTSIRESGGRVAAIVNNMLSFARKSDATISSHDLSSLIDKSLELAATDYDLKKHFDFRKIEIIREYDEDLPLVPCEGTKIQQVLLNILRNGAEAMHEAGTENPRFIFRLKQENSGAAIRLEIEDNGPGMTEEIRKRVFEPFYTTKPVGVGTGLGLSVSYFIITENHNGEMAVESKQGVGTQFIIKLPVYKSAALAFSQELSDG